MLHLKSKPFLSFNCTTTKYSRKVIKWSPTGNGGGEVLSRSPIEYVTNNFKVNPQAIQGSLILILPKDLTDERPRCEIRGKFKCSPEARNEAENLLTRYQTSLNLEHDEFREGVQMTMTQHEKDQIEMYDLTEKAKNSKTQRQSQLQEHVKEKMFETAGKYNLQGKDTDYLETKTETLEHHESQLEEGGDFRNKIGKTFLHKRKRRENELLTEIIQRIIAEKVEEKVNQSKPLIEETNRLRQQLEEESRRWELKLEENNRLRKMVEEKLQEMEQKIHKSESLLKENDVLRQQIEKRKRQSESKLDGNGRLKQQLEQKIHESEEQIEKNVKPTGVMEEKINSGGHYWKKTVFLISR
ncbi:hypothetical protein AWC38_SpisGene16974 [Stylophora pistillata]|uniref:Uncharacterized protein n=1 Tax=Stylophora pistillata TaxID=50429 RepID=A0A2B4RPD7_STYPI|nr:hypothetical protein AWC38_SpisGene16974 [Stylophora pistillata]